MEPSCSMRKTYARFGFMRHLFLIQRNYYSFDFQKRVTNPWIGLTHTQGIYARLLENPRDKLTDSLALASVIRIGSVMYVLRIYGLFWYKHHNQNLNRTPNSNPASNKISIQNL